jgi:GT2 family glycosyltransferase
MRREVIEQIGLFDPRYFLYYEEVDHCFAAKRAGWQVIFYPGTAVVHIGGESARSAGELTQSGRQLEALQIESELLYFRKNHGSVGVGINVLLTVIGDVIVILKRILLLKAVSTAYIRHSLLVLSLFRRTAWGTRPTR